MARLTLPEAAAELRKTPRWLREWLRLHPRDKSGEPYCTPIGRDKLFHPSDLVRIEGALREEASCRSGSGRRAPAKRRITKSVESTLGSELRVAAGLTGDRSLLSSSERSKNASKSTDNIPHLQHLRLVKDSQPS